MSSPVRSVPCGVQSPAQSRWQTAQAEPASSVACAGSGVVVRDWFRQPARLTRLKSPSAAMPDPSGLAVSSDHGSPWAFLKLALDSLRHGIDEHEGVDFTAGLPALVASE